MLVLALLCGCTALSTDSTPSYPLFATPISLDANRLVRIPRERVDRYICETGAPIVCSCFSRLSYDCDCSC